MSDTMTPEEEEEARLNYIKHTVEFNELTMVKLTLEINKLKQELEMVENDTIESNRTRKARDYMTKVLNRKSNYYG